MTGCTSPTSHSQRRAEGKTTSGTQKALLQLTFLLTQQIRAHLAGEVFAKATGRQNSERRGGWLAVAGKASSSMRETFAVRILARGCNKISKIWQKQAGLCWETQEGQVSLSCA